MKRTDIRRMGEHGSRVILFKEGHLARVQWRRNGKLLTKSFPKAVYTSEALAFARGVLSGRDMATVGNTVGKTTLLALWGAFQTEEFPHLRERSRQIYTENWRQWVTMWGREFPADATTQLMMPEFVAALRKRELSPNTLREIVRVVKQVYDWGEQRELLQRNRVHLFELKIHKDERPKPPEEYRREDFEKLLAAFNPELKSQWRPYVALAICGYQGARQNAVLHLKWGDIVFSGENERITWRAEWDKMGKEWSQPIRSVTRAALEYAIHAKESEWVLPSGSSKNTGETYSPQSLWAALKAAQIRAGVPNIERRGAHGLRRMLAGDVMAATGDPSLATAAIGDSIGQAPRYIKTRADAVDAAILGLDKC